MGKGSKAMRTHFTQYRKKGNRAFYITHMEKEKEERTERGIRGLITLIFIT